MKLYNNNLYVLVKGTRDLPDIGTPDMPDILYAGPYAKLNVGRLFLRKSGPF